MSEIRSNRETKEAMLDLSGFLVALIAMVAIAAQSKPHDIIALLSLGYLAVLLLRRH